MRTHTLLAVLLSLVAVGAEVPAVADAALVPAWSPPVDGPVVRGFEPAATPFGPRHLGLDYAVPSGTAVGAAGDGIVVFAGRVGSAFAVGVEHIGARRTTYAYLQSLAVTKGANVARGDVVGTSGGMGPGHGPDVVHFGLRLAGVPTDPAVLFAGRPPVRINLAPLDAPPPGPIVCRSKH